MAEDMYEFFQIFMSTHSKYQVSKLHGAQTRLCLGGLFCSRLGFPGYHTYVLCRASHFMCLVKGALCRLLTFIDSSCSYAGHYVPAFSARVLQGNKAGTGIHINLNGSAIGNVSITLWI